MPRSGASVKNHFESVGGGLGGDPVCPLYVANGEDVADVPLEDVGVSLVIALSPDHGLAADVLRRATGLQDDVFVHHLAEVDGIVPIVRIAEVDDGALGSDHRDRVLQGANLVANRLDDEVVSVALGGLLRPRPADRCLDAVESERGSSIGAVDEVDPGD
ncbi:MAG: hypothetical protein ACI89G_002505 [Minisyncoccia bacterium]|jgi:hypothetical protein